MTTFATTFTILSLALFLGFLLLSFHKFGILASYSSYAAKWTEDVPLDPETHVWSIVTVMVAILLTPAMLEVGDESPLQFLGFFAPAYLIVVAMTPDWETKIGQRIVHIAGAIICAWAVILWLVFALNWWFIIPCAFIVFAAIGYLTKTLKTSYILWAELAMFASVYFTVLI